LYDVVVTFMTAAAS